MLSLGLFIGILSFVAGTYFGQYVLVRYITHKAENHVSIKFQGAWYKIEKERW